MTRKYTQITFTDAVRERQEHFGTRAGAARVEAWEIDDEHLSAEESGFIAARDSFYMATVNADGWPYLQFRGGPRGFLKVLDEQTLGYADFRGNGQLIGTGNLQGDERTALFFMDYANRRRLKLMARAEVVDAAERPELLARLRDPDYRGRVERLVLFHVVAFDWNCPQHITPRFTEQELAERAPAASPPPREASPARPSRSSAHRALRVHRPAWTPPRLSDSHQEPGVT